MALVLMGITGALSLPAPKLTSIRHLLLSRAPACLQDLRVSGAHAPVDTGRPGDTQDSPQGEGRLWGGVTEQVPRETDICLVGWGPPRSPCSRSHPHAALPSLTSALGAAAALRGPPARQCPLLQVVRSYKATVQQTLDVLFLREGTEFLSSTDASSRDSADRTIIAWDFRSAAKISNQIFHVRNPVWHGFWFRSRMYLCSPRLCGVPGHFL